MLIYHDKKTIYYIGGLCMPMYVSSSRAGLRNSYKLRTIDAIMEANEFVNNKLTENTMIISLSDYHSNIQWQSMRNAIIDEFPELIILTDGTNLLLIKTCIQAFNKKSNKKFFNMLRNTKKK